MRIKDAAKTAGIIVETLSSAGFPTGNVYKMTSAVSPDGKHYAWLQYRQGKRKLHPNVACRVLDPKPFSGQYGPF
jgi:hypothetical protein